MIWDILDIIMNFFRIFPDWKGKNQATEHFKNL